jgi:hypothetical protein
VERVLNRDRAVLEQVGTTIQWPTQYDRVLAAARGIYRAEPVGAVSWDGYRRTARIDLAYAPDWLRMDPAELGGTVGPPH